MGTAAAVVSRHVARGLQLPATPALVLSVGIAVMSVARGLLIAMVLALWLDKPAGRWIALMETDQRWLDALAPKLARYQHVLAQPLDNT